VADKALRIAISAAVSVSAIRTPAKDARWTFVYAPGAGSNIHDPFGAYAANALAPHGVTTVRFQFPYMEAGKRGPDRPPVLEAAWRAAIDTVRDPKTRIVAGGRSMGGRIASMVAASTDAAAVDAVALFAYPLHPPGKPKQLRTAHFATLKAPALFVSGTNDAFASPAELRAATRQLKRAKLHLLDRADHGYAVPKSSGRTREDVWAEAVGVFVEWLAGLD
jgi:predicted alpha/beta-hydrolase family hydrolase